ncbi:MAG: hypothetical protein WEB00_08805 [Dehalococcoidia bacterium]
MAVLTVLATLGAHTASAGLPQTFTVNSTADTNTLANRQACLSASTTDSCTLRAAISLENNNNNQPTQDFINFDISGTSTLNVGSALPTVTEPLVLDGENPIGTGVILDGQGGNYGAMVFAAGNSWLRNIIVRHFGLSGNPIKAVELQSGDANLVTNSWFQSIVGTGLHIADSDNNQIGGSGAGEGNLFQTSNGAGLEISSLASTTQVFGNKFGTNFSGTAALGNQTGLRDLGIASIIGGAAAGEGNLISGNITGLRLGGTDAVVQGNLVGTQSDGTSALPNTGPGIHVVGGEDILIGGTGAERNVIAFNQQAGIVAGDSGENVEIRGNSIHSNNGAGILFAALVINSIEFTVRANSIFGNGGLGIDFGGGPVPNDAGDGDPGANLLQNHPNVTAAVAASAAITIDGSLSSAPSSTYTVDFYASPVCNAPVPNNFGEGKRFLGSKTVQTAGNGIIAFSFTLLKVVAAGDVVTATATDAAGNTSEFSRCRVVTTAVVTCEGQTATIVGSASDNAINGTAGDDVIAGRAGEDTINGLGGNDSICGGPDNDDLKGGDGTDTLNGGPHGADPPADKCTGGPNPAGQPDVLRPSCETQIP